jgi:peptidoglycan/xylan/chitin deacetylase (PgdA/CDA1 family)
VSERGLIVCYHRILGEGDASGKPYLARGTAVSEATFARQIDALASRFEVLGEDDFLAWHRGARRGGRPPCWITFDDGYSDVYHRAAPQLAARGIAGSIFVTTRVLEDRTAWLPADAWYATLSRAESSGRSIPDYARRVDGPERRAYLRGTPELRERALHALAAELDAPPLAVPGDLYMTPDQIRALSLTGWSVGGHGHTHAILTSVAVHEMHEEITRSREALRRLGLDAATIAYPDGAHDEAVRDAARKAGWSAGLALGDRSVSRGDPMMALPRFVARDDPEWVELVHSRQ